MLLCLDTSRGASVALLSGFTALARAANDNPRQHTETLAPMIHDVLAGAGASMTDLTGIAVGTGPAPFTGLRVGLITARTLGQALGIPVFGIPALAGIARAAFDAEPIPEVVVVTDARRTEVYWARYAPSGEHDVVELSPPAVARPQVLAEQVRGQLLRGYGVQLYPEHFEGRGQEMDPAALGRIALTRRQVAEVSGGEADLPAEPLYLRRPDIHEGAGRKRAS